MQVPLTMPNALEDPVGGQAFLDRADQRDAARHRGLESQHDAVPARLLEQLGAVVGEERLVGGDHVLAGGERLEDERARRLEAADQLDHDLDLRVVEHPVGVADQRQPRQVEPLARPRQVGVGDAAKHEPAARALLHLGAVALQDLDDAAAHRAEARAGRS